MRAADDLRPLTVLHVAAENLDPMLATGLDHMELDRLALVVVPDLVRPVDDEGIGTRIVERMSLMSI